MKNINRDLILKRFEKVDEMLRELRRTQGISREQFLSDPRIYLSAQRALEIAINACIDIGAHVVSLHDIKAPEHYSQIFDHLHELGIITGMEQVALIKMTKFRNLLGHFYLDVDNRIVFSIIQENLRDFERFKQAIVSSYKDVLQARGS